MLCYAAVLISYYPAPKTKYPRNLEHTIEMKFMNNSERNNNKTNEFHQWKHTRYIYGRFITTYSDEVCVDIV